MKTLGPYRFVIIGAGSAGCLIARILAERTSDTIALVEAGTAMRDVRGKCPALYPRLFGGQYDWAFRSLPQPGLAGRHIPWPRGKTLGGSGAINALIYLQAAVGDFEAWNWPQPVLPSASAGSRGAPAVCPISGLVLSPVAAPHPWTEAFLQAAETAGLRRNNHMFSCVAGECGLYHLTQSQAARICTGTQLAEFAMQHSNLHIIQGANVGHIGLRGNRAHEVLLTTANREQQRLAVEGEVILCGGAVGSPKVLMDSGIGPAQALAEAGIPPQLDLPQVGQNLADHLVYPLIYQAKQSAGMPSRFSAEHRRQYRQQGTGPLASNIAEAGAIIEVPNSGLFQLHFTPTHYLKYPLTPTTNQYFSIGLTQLAPSSRGQIDCRGNIDPQYLSADFDLQATVNAVRWVQENIVCNLQDLISKEMLPGKRGLKAGGLEKSIRMFAQSIYHPTSTCRAGMDSRNSVVAADFRVHAVEALRIADASVLPGIPHCNTQAPSLHAAALCADACLGSS